MKDSENIYDMLRDMLGNAPGQFNILEEQIDIDVQMEYFEQSQKSKEQVDRKDVMARKEDIFKSNFSEEERKELFILLASVDEVEAYRTIERYLKTSRKDLRDWAMLALQESRMLLESQLLGENQVFISTGLGGKEDKLRYFIVLLRKYNGPYTEFEKKIIHSEFDFVFLSHDCELEKISFSTSFCTLMVVIPMHVNVKQVIRESITESNLFGGFLKSNFIVTNVKELSEQEIIHILEKHDREKLK